MKTEQNAVPCEEVRSEIYLHARQTKLLIWGNLNRGRCEQSEGQLELRSDGSGRWSCMTSTRSAQGSDVWYADFVVKGQNGETLFGIGPFYSPQMSLGANGTAYRWSASFTFNAEMFSAIHAAVQNCGCLPPVHSLLQASRPEVIADAGWCRLEMASALGGAYA